MQIQKKKRSLIKYRTKNKYSNKRNKGFIGGLPGKKGNNPVTISILIVNISPIRNPQSYRAEFQTTDSVLTIKNNIRANLGIPTTDQRITFQGDILDDRQTLEECGINEGSTVNVENTYASGIITVTVSNFDMSNQLTIIAPYNNTVLAVKQAISDRFKIDVKNMRLHFMDDILPDEVMLYQIGLVNERSVIFVENLYKK